MTEILLHAEFHSGAQAWNDGDPFAAHEHWEILWHVEKGAARTFLQGLIQLAAARVKSDRGLTKGFVSLSRKGLSKLKLSSTKLPANWQKWIAEVGKLIDSAISQGDIPAAWPDVPLK